MGHLLPNQIKNPEGAEAGYFYDYLRQNEKAKREKIEKYDKLKKRMDKLARSNKVIKRR